MKYKTFKDLTVADYQQLYIISKSDIDEVEKSIQLVAVLTGLPRWDVEAMSITDFNKVSREINVIFSNQKIEHRLARTVKVAGKKYLIQYNVRKLTAGQYIDIQTFGKGDMIENMHRIFASLLIPCNRFFGVKKYDGTNHELISEGVRDMNFVYVHGACVFFLTLWNNSIAAIRGYLKEEMMKMGSPLEDITEMDLQRFMAGSIMPNR